MNKKNTLLILWIIFGFIFITGINSILYFIIYLIYFAKSELGLSYGIMKFTMPITTLILYVLTTLFIVKKIRTNSKLDGIYLNKFPGKTFLILLIISIILNPLTNFLDGQYAAFSPRMKNVSFSEFYEFYEWMNSGIYLSKFGVLIILTIIFFRRLKLMENKN